MLEAVEPTTVPLENVTVGAANARRAKRRINKHMLFGVAQQRVKVN
jgi:hypothetical protein